MNEQAQYSSIMLFYDFLEQNFSKPTGKMKIKDTVFYLVPVVMFHEGIKSESLYHLQ